MPDNIPITPAMPSHTGKTPPPVRELQQAVAVDPARVPTTNQKDPSGQRARFDFSPDHPSVFGAFEQRLRELPGLDRTLQNLMFELFSRSGNVRDAEALSARMRELSAAARMDRPAMAENLLFQIRHHTAFHSALFDQLRRLLKEYGEPGLETRVAAFLKAYSGAFSAARTMRSLRLQLGVLAAQLPAFFGRKLEPLAQRLKDEPTRENIRENVRFIKEEIIPVLREYAFTTNDQGKTRDAVTLFVHTLARLNLSSPEDMPERFRALLDYCRHQLSLPPQALRALEELFAREIAAPRETPENAFYSAFLQTLGETGESARPASKQAALNDVRASLLLDNSVYMPFIHAFLPVDHAGRFLFSEIWVEKEPRGRASGDNAPACVLVRFEIRDLGSFEMQIDIRQNQADVRLSVPAPLREKEAEIRRSVAEIFSENSLTAGSVTLTGGAAFVTEQILKKVLERRDSVDVAL